MNDEIMKPINGFDGYYISNIGNVYSNKKRELKKMKPFLDSKKRYWMIKLIDNTGKRKAFLVHRLVAIYFVVNPNPEYFLEVNHKDNNPRNSHYMNLEWCTRKENLRQSYNTLSPKRNCNKCVLYKNHERINDFESIIAAAKYAQEHYSISSSSLERNLRSQDIVIIPNKKHRKSIIKTCID